MIRDGLLFFHSDLESLLRPIDSVRQHPKNYNNGDVERIAESIEVNGMYRPIYVQASTGFIIAGNHTWEACKFLNATQIPVVSLDVDDITATRILIADNRLAALARPDDAELLRLLDALHVETGNTHGTGFEENEIEALRLLQEQLADQPMGFGQTPSALENPHQCPACGAEWVGGCRPDPETTQMR